MEVRLDEIKKAVVRIATPYSSGTGFFYPESNYVITNEHIVNRCKQIVVEDYLDKGYNGQVVYTDSVLDLAIIRLDNTGLCTKCQVIKDIVDLGTEVLAISQPYGSSFAYSAGDVVEHNFEHEGGSFIRHSAALKLSESGGPLVLEDGSIVGLNASIKEANRLIGIALPIGEIIPVIEKLNEAANSRFVRCTSCRKTNADENNGQNTCHYCGTAIQYISNFPEYKPIGIAKRIEDILSKLDYEPSLARRGQYTWEIIKGSALIIINYHPNSGFLIAESKLCEIKSMDNLDLYEYLLRQNKEVTGLTFSIKGNTIILSLMIYDQHLQEETTLELLNHLFYQSDLYDDLLIEKFNSK